MATQEPGQLAAAVRAACIQAALDGYERAQIAGLCQEGAWECAVDAMRMIDLTPIAEAAAAAADPQERPSPPSGPRSSGSRSAVRETRK